MKDCQFGVSPVNYSDSDSDDMIFLALVRATCLAFPFRSKQVLRFTESVIHWTAITRFRDSSARNHFGPGLLGPDDSAHFSIRDCSAHYYFFFLGGGVWGEAIYCFILFSLHQNKLFKIQEFLFNVKVNLKT